MHRVMARCAPFDSVWLAVMSHPLPVTEQGLLWSREAGYARFGTQVPPEQWKFATQSESAEHVDLQVLLFRQIRFPAQA
jgi:hypothetical protein